jgi:hypothetical protein
MDAHGPVTVESPHGSVAGHHVAHVLAKNGPIDFGFGALTTDPETGGSPQGVRPVGRCPQGGGLEAALLGP